MSPEERQEIIQDAVKALGFDRPVLDMRVVGSRFELHLYGGEVVVYDPLAESTQQEPSPPAPLPRAGEGSKKPARKIPPSPP